MDILHQLFQKHKIIDNNPYVLTLNNNHCLGSTKDFAFHSHHWGPGLEHLKHPFVSASVSMCI